MSVLENIQGQTLRVVSGIAWHGPSLNEILKDVDHQTALARKIPGKYNIWELVLHIITWTKLGAQALEGKPRPFELTPEEDWPSVSEATEEAWRATLAELEEVHLRFAEGLKRLQPADLQKKVSGRDYTFDFLCSGVVHHTVYHAGQISLLKNLEV